jgi:hypothetical protein
MAISALMMIPGDMSASRLTRIGALLARNTSFTFTVSFRSAFLVCAVMLTRFLPETEGTALR